MAANQEAYSELPQLLDSALQSGNPAELERYLTESSGLPGPRMNLALVAAFAGLIARLVKQPDPPVESIEALLDGWAALSLADAPVNDPREILPACAAMSYGQVAVARPDWWEDEVAKLHRAASNPRWRMREIVATALQAMLKAGWQRAYAVLEEWVKEDDPLVLRAAAAAIAEPPLLISQERGEQAVAIQQKAVEGLAKVPPDRRHAEEVQALRKGLGYTLSVATAAAPDAGFALLEKLANSEDKDLRWVARENLKKNRLQPWADRVKALEARLATA